MKLAERQSILQGENAYLGLIEDSEHREFQGAKRTGSSRIPCHDLSRIDEMGIREPMTHQR